MELYFGWFQVDFYRQHHKSALCWTGKDKFQFVKLQFFYYSNTLVPATPCLHYSINIQLLAALVLKSLFLFLTMCRRRQVISALQLPSWWSHNICRKIGHQKWNPQGVFILKIILVFTEWKTVLLIQTISDITDVVLPHFFRLYDRTVVTTFHWREF